MGVKWTMCFLGLGNKNDSSIHCNVLFFFPIQQRSGKLWNCFFCNESPLLRWRRGCPCALHWFEASLTAYGAVMFYPLLNKRQIPTVKCIWEQVCVVFFWLFFFKLEFFVCRSLFYCESWSLSWIEIQCLLRLFVSSFTFLCFGLTRLSFVANIMRRFLSEFVRK